MVRAAKAQGIGLTGPDGLLKQPTKTVVEVSLEEEMTDHRAFQARGRRSGVGEQPQRHPDEDSAHRHHRPVDIEVPHDRNGTFEPVNVAKHQRRLNGVDDIVLSSTAKGLTTGRSARTSLKPPDGGG